MLNAKIVLNVELSNDGELKLEVETSGSKSKNFNQALREFSNKLPDVFIGVLAALAANQKEEESTRVIH